MIISFLIILRKRSITFLFTLFVFIKMINPLNAELNPICRFLALLGAHHILHVSRIRVNENFKSVYLF
jgi:hypothetical protein